MRKREIDENGDAFSWLAAAVKSWQVKEINLHHFVRSPPLTTTCNEEEVYLLAGTLNHLRKKTT